MRGSGHETRCRMCPTAVRSRSEPQACARSSRPCGRWMRVRGTCGPRSPASSGATSEVAELQAAVKAHRSVTLPGGRGRQDPAGAGSGGAAGTTNFRTGSGFSSWPRSPIRPRCPTPWPRCWASPSNRTRASASPWPPPWRAGCGWWCRQLRARRDAAADLVEAILAASATVTILATSREGLGVADEQLWLVPSLDVSAGTESAAVTLFVDRAQSVASGLLGGPALTRRPRWSDLRRLDGISRWPSSWRPRGWRR